MARVRKKGSAGKPDDLMVFSGIFDGCTEREIKVSLEVSPGAQRTVILPISQVDITIRTEERTAEIGVPRWLAEQAGLLP